MYGKRWCGTSLSMSPLKVPTPMAVSLWALMGGAGPLLHLSPLPSFRWPLPVAWFVPQSLMCSASACFVDCHLHTEPGVRCCHLAGGSDPRLLNLSLPRAPVPARPVLVAWDTLLSLPSSHSHPSNLSPRQASKAMEAEQARLVLICQGWQVCSGSSSENTAGGSCPGE